MHELNLKASGVPCSPPCAPHRPNTLLRSPPAGHLLPHFALNSRLPSLVPSEPARPCPLPLNPLLSEPLNIDEHVGIVANDAWLIPHYQAFAPEVLGEAAARNADPALPGLEPLSLDENVGSVANKAWLIPVRPRPCLCCTPVRPSRHPMRQWEAQQQDKGNNEEIMKDNNNLKNNDRPSDRLMDRLTHRPT